MCVRELWIFAATPVQSLISTWLWTALSAWLWTALSASSLHCSPFGKTTMPVVIILFQHYLHYSIIIFIAWPNDLSLRAEANQSQHLAHLTWYASSCSPKPWFSLSQKPTPVTSISRSQTIPLAPRNELQDTFSWPSCCAGEFLVPSREAQLK